MTRLVVKRESAPGPGNNNARRADQLPPHDAQAGSTTWQPSHAAQQQQQLLSMMRDDAPQLFPAGAQSEASHPDPFSNAAAHGAATRHDGMACHHSHEYDPYATHHALASAHGCGVAGAWHKGCDDDAIKAGQDMVEAGAAQSASRHGHAHAGWNQCGNNGYNSGGENSADEADGRAAGKERDFDENELEEILNKEKGFRIKRMEEDGNCLFRAISDQIYGDPGMHQEVRKLCMDYLWTEREHFSQFVTQDFDNYVKRKRHDKIFGNNLEMQAISELFNRPIEVYRDSPHPMKIFHEGYLENCQSTPLRLSYHRGNHYNSVVNPKEHTVGEGLGIPLPKPQVQSPHEEQIAEEYEKIALRASEEDDLEAAILESVLRASRETWEQSHIQAELDQASVRESRQDYYQSFSTSASRSGGGAQERAGAGASGHDFCAAGGRSSC